MKSIVSTDDDIICALKHFLSGVKLTFVESKLLQSKINPTSLTYKQFLQQYSSVLERPPSLRPTHKQLAHFHHLIRQICRGAYKTQGEQHLKQEIKQFLKSHEETPSLLTQLQQRESTFSCVAEFVASEAFGLNQQICPPELRGIGLTAEEVKRVDCIERQEYIKQGKMNESIENAIPTEESKKKQLNSRRNKSKCIEFSDDLREELKRLTQETAQILNRKTE